VDLSFGYIECFLIILYILPMIALNLINSRKIKTCTDIYELNITSLVPFFNCYITLCIIEDGDFKLENMRDIRPLIYALPVLLLTLLYFI
jgi:hypothetical protein